jgi:cytochrome c-type biogenesis protein CcmH
MTSQIEQIKQQLRQLADLARDGVLPEDQYQTARQKLERQLVDVVMAATPSTAQPIAQPTAEPEAAAAASKPLSAGFKLGMVGFIAAVGVGGYLWLGKPHAWGIGPATDATAASATPAMGGVPDPSGKAPHPTDTDQIMAMTESLAAKLKDNPDNAEGWAMLARSYAVLSRFDEAIPAYKKAIAQRTDDAQLYADYADALAVKSGRQFGGEPAAMVAKALAIDPTNFKALSLSGTMAFERKDYKAAADLWERALQRGPTDNPELVQQIQGALADARQRAGLPAITKVSAQGAPAPAVATASQEVSGQVTISPEAKAKVAPGDTVFIFARAAQGPRMPLAILRKQVKDLPSQFSLNDAMAMSPEMKLSSFNEVVIGARVSKAGQAMPQPGDWQGQSKPVKLGSQGVQVEISEAVR